MIYELFGSWRDPACKHAVQPVTIIYHGPRGSEREGERESERERETESESESVSER